VNVIVPLGDWWVFCVYTCTPGGRFASSLFAVQWLEVACFDNRKTNSAITGLLTKQCTVRSPFRSKNNLFKQWGCLSPVTPTVPIAAKWHGTQKCHTLVIKCCEQVKLLQQATCGHCFIRLPSFPYHCIFCFFASVALGSSFQMTFRHASSTLFHLELDSWLAKKAFHINVGDSCSSKWYLKIRRARTRT